MKDAAQGESLRFTLDGFDTLTIPLGTLDTTVDVKLKKSEPTFKFGYALKNAPTPSKGCGTNSTLKKVKSVENGDQFQIKVGNDTRDYFITLPKNYDNKKPHKVLFALHCYGSRGDRLRTTASKCSTRTATTSSFHSTLLAAFGPRDRAITISSHRLSQL